MLLPSCLNIIQCVCRFSVIQVFSFEFEKHFVSFSAQDVEIHTDSAKALADSLDGAKVDGFPYFNTLLRILATRCMMQATYFCSGMDSDFHHYGLASPIYTHFTSPIRRYDNRCSCSVGLYNTEKSIIAKLTIVLPSPTQIFRYNGSPPAGSGHRSRQHLPRFNGQTQAVRPLQQPQLQTQDVSVCSEVVCGLPHTGKHWFEGR